MTDEEIMLSNLWCSKGCPRKMTLHLPENRTVILLEGQIVSDTLKNTKSVPQDQQLTVTKNVTEGARSWRRFCEHCGKPFDAARKDQRYDTATCRKMASKKRRATALLSLMERRQYGIEAIR